MSTAIALPSGGVTVPDRLKVGWIAILTVLASIASSAPVWIGKLADDAKPLGVNPAFFVYATVAILITGILIRGAIAAVRIYQAGTTDVTSGFTTYLGIGATILAALPAILQELASAAGPLNVPPEVWTRAAVYLTLATSAMKGLQFLAAATNFNNLPLPDDVVPAPTPVPPPPPVVETPATPDPATPPVNDPETTDQGDAGESGFPRG